mgnify:CR=1 FL=1
MPENKTEQKIDDFLKNEAKDSCLSCENFGTKTCPAFNEAVNNKGIDENALKTHIQIAQENKTLIPCVNSNDDIEP